MKKFRNAAILILFSSFFFNACSVFQPGKPLLQKRIDSLMVTDFFKTTQVGISVYDLKNNQPVYEQNEKLLFRPASNQKIFTTAAALKFLSANHKFSTVVSYSGELKDSVCSGNLYFTGGFDPEFSSHDLDSLVKEIKKAGIKEIKGNLYGDVSAMDSMFWGSGWIWDDDPEAYMPYLSPLTINKNCIIISFKPGAIGSPAVISLNPEINFLPIINTSVTTENGKSDFRITRDWLNRKNTILVSGNLPAKSNPESVTLNLVNPALNFLNLAKESLIKNKIILNGIIDTSTIKMPVTKITSFERDINYIIKVTNKRSDNLNAEMVLRETAHKYFGKSASADKGKVLVDSLIILAGKNPRQYKFIDGSGLSYYDLLTADLITNVLKYMYEQEPSIKENFINSLPVAGIDGTLSNRFKNSPVKGHLFAKTGTLSGVSNLSGYLDTVNGNKLAFSILIQNFVGSASMAREFQEKICQIFYEEL